MSETISREAVERVKAKTPPSVHPQVERAAERVRVASAPARVPGMRDHRTDVTMDDIEGGHGKLARIMEQVTPEALARRKQEIAGLTLEEALAGEVRGGSRVAGYRDTEFARAFWSDRETPPDPPSPPDPPERPPLERVH